MDRNQVLQDMNKIFTRVLGDDDIELNYETVAADIEDWDSLNHIQLVVAIEKHFKVRFTAAEIQSWKNVGEMCDSVIKRNQQ